MAPCVLRRGLRAGLGDPGQFDESGQLETNAGPPAGQALEAPPEQRQQVGDDGGPLQELGLQPPRHNRLDSPEQNMGVDRRTLGRQVRNP